VELTVFPYSLEIKHDDELHTIDIPGLEAPRCRSCGQLVFGVSVERQINSAQRRKLRLLQPAEVRQGRENLGLSRAEFAKRLGIAEAAFADWEDDISVQPRTADNLMRVFFAFPEVRAALTGSQRDESLGVLVG
jgi:DNA-binding transcriptional regulator YiaG